MKKPRFPAKGLPFARDSLSSPIFAQLILLSRLFGFGDTVPS